MDSLRYTPFPDLRSTHQLDEVPCEFSAHSVYDEFPLPFEILVIAWSRFVRAYTAADDIVFAADDSTILVRASQDPDYFEQCEQISIQASQATGLSYSGAPVRCLGEDSQAYAYHVIAPVWQALVAMAESRPCSPQRDLTYLQSSSFFTLQ